MVDLSRKSTKWLISISINVIVLIAYFIFTDLTYESNDDYSIAKKLVSDGFLNISYVNYFLCKFISFFQIRFLSTINGFVLSQIILSFVSLTILTYIFFTSERGRVFSFITIAIASIYAYDHYTMVQFTKTSALLMTAGTVIIIHVFLDKKKPYIAGAGIFLVILGSAYRFANIYPAFFITLAFLAVFLLHSVISHKKEKSKSRPPIKLLYKKSKMKALLGIILCLAICFTGASLLNKASVAINISDDSLKEYREYNKYRARAVDYPLPKYEENVDFYDSLGISHNDLYVFRKHRYYDYNGVAKLENLKAISERQKIEKKEKSIKAARNAFFETTWKEIINLTNRGIHIVLLTILGLLGALFCRKKWMLYPIAIWGIAMMGYIYLYYIGRAPYRATYIIDIMATALLLYSYRTAELRKFAIKLFTTRKAAVAIVVVSFTLLLSVFSANLLHENYREKGHDHINSDELWRHMRENDDKLFVFDLTTSTGLYKYNLTEYLNPLKLNPVTKKNQVSFGGWSTNSPHQKEIIAQYGLNNIYEDIIDRKDVIVVSNNCKSDPYGNCMYKREVVQYFNEEYPRNGYQINFVLIDTIGGFKLWQVRTEPSMPEYYESVTPNE